MAFVAVAMARTGHRGDALRMLTFLQGVQAGDGGFEARYRLDGSGPPDDRPRQSDGPGWALWAMGEVLRAGTTPPGAADLRPLRPLLDRSTSYALRLVDDGRRLPPPSPDYWEVPVARTSLGTVAPLLAGLRASARLYDALGRTRRRRSAPARPPRGCTGELRRDFAADGYQRFGRYGGRDASVTFLMPPFADQPDPGVVRAWEQYQREALRPAGGLAPGAQWKKDGASWTPETAHGRLHRRRVRAARGGAARGWTGCRPTPPRGGACRRRCSRTGPLGPGAAGLERGGGRARGGRAWRPTGRPRSGEWRGRPPGAAGAA